MTLHLLQAYGHVLPGRDSVITWIKAKFKHRKMVTKLSEIWINHLRQCEWKNISTRPQIQKKGTGWAKIAKDCDNGFWKLLGYTTFKVNIVCLWETYSFAMKLWFLHFVINRNCFFAYIKFYSEYSAKHNKIDLTRPWHSASWFVCLFFLFFINYFTGFFLFQLHSSM